MSEAIIEPKFRQHSGPAMQDLNDLYLFALVVNKGSFTAASKAAGLTTSRISRRVANLEARLGVRLLHRTTRKLALTPIGELYFQHCQAMVSEAEAAAEVVEQIQLVPRGRVSVTCPVLTAHSVLGEVITDFMRAYPEVHVSLTATDRIINLIDEGFDVAIRFRTQPLEDSSLVARSLGESRSYLVASPEFLDKHGRPVQPSDLLRLVTTGGSLGKSRHDSAYTWHLTGTDDMSTVIPYKPLLDSDDWLVIKQAVLAGLGVAAIPDELCRQEVTAGKLEILLPQWHLPSINLYIVYTSRRGLIPAVRMFIDFATQRLKEICLAAAHSE